MAVYRSPTKVVGEILTIAEQTGQQGIRPTPLMAKANIPSSKLSKFMKNLTNAGLIATKEIDKKMHL
ncbi:winged helix-turn-helix domain-containing protein [Nitrosopumilus sp.]|uniref:winged helix-turn-helix domain-containing protein n=1 Tax=Nitrosopumilus sp. TaxID=2024843 RepID=UPI002602F8B5|nr:winged helix-turn-helix domain-containing protein [Nitrosopumilus sp.]